jgi:translation initiation factor 2 subunit 1
LITEFPEENELVLAVVKKIMPYGAFCVLPEYGDREAFMHVSEVAPRWIKNIHEFLSEGQRHVVKVHRMDRTKGQIDVSLKRVNEEEKKLKLESVQTAKKAAKMLEISITTSKATITIPDAEKEITEHYGDAYEMFQEVSEKGMDALEKLKLPKAMKEKIVELAQKNIKKPVFEVDGIAKMISYSPDGIEDIKKILKEEQKENHTLKIHYLGAPNYKLSVTGGSYKEAEKILTKITDRIGKKAQDSDCEFSFEKTEA